MDQGQKFILRSDKRGINFEDCEKLERTPHSIHFKDYLLYGREVSVIKKKKLHLNLNLFNEIEYVSVTLREDSCWSLTAQQSHR